MRPSAPSNFADLCRTIVKERERGAEIRGNNFDVVRRRNLSILLGRVHALGGLSRAQMTRETGLNRETIAGLVGERPSSVVRPSKNIVAITVNPEVDAVTIGLVGLGGRVIRQVRPDNGSCYRSGHFNAALGDITHALTAPKRTEKSSASIAPWPSNGPTTTTTTQSKREQQLTKTGFMTTTTTNPIPASEANHPSTAYTASMGRTPRTRCTYSPKRTRSPRRGTQPKRVSAAICRMAAEGLPVQRSCTLLAVRNHRF